MSLSMSYDVNSATLAPWTFVMTTRGITSTVFDETLMKSLPGFGYMYHVSSDHSFLSKLLVLISSIAKSQIPLPYVPNRTMFSGYKYSTDQYVCSGAIFSAIGYHIPSDKIFT